MFAYGALGFAVGIYASSSGIAPAVALQLWRKNFLLSIVLSTIICFIWAKAQGILDGFSGL
ncbi:hypothetical protein [Campylobacter sp.]|uniref:hypothetical protein n=1 Tax=Campylobacter sp. TaxID=205 RepID=UPI002AA671C1|nr:hypothetical protein [Campylobacter sp.]MCI7581877.1 hypothetical protein [Campylobacter sp.]